ncbi:MAG: helix-turn-helix transcriptional regulator [Bacteroidales bacterium]|nr:helix-turn-helix transcriptional regulator [Bacteroidales bacterium]
MKTINDKFQQMLSNVPQDTSMEIEFSFAIAKEIDTLMREKGLTKKQFADALGKKPSEVTKWLSGQHNFTIRTLAMLSSFFGRPIIQIYPMEYPLPKEEHISMVAEDITPMYNAKQ